MIPKDVGQITEDDFQTLIDNAVLEGKTIEYKEELPGNSDKNKKEFLADVSSFANTVGGDLIFGISEDTDTGHPKELVGLDTENIDKEIARLDNMIRANIEPRILGWTIQHYKLSNSKIIILIRIPRSWISPHRVVYQGHGRFFARSSNGKYSLDVSELRVAFNLSETLSERIRKFREDRVSKIYSGETPLPFKNRAKIVLQLIPFDAFTPAKRYDISDVTSTPVGLLPIAFHADGSRYNLDGYLMYGATQEGEYRSYVQLFSNGIIEAVDSSLLIPYGDKLGIPSVAFEEKIIESVNRYISTLKRLSVELPIFLFMTLVGVEGYFLHVDPAKAVAQLLRGGPFQIDRDILMLPEIVIDKYDIDGPSTLKPCFDATWNACGYSRSLNYNASGEWRPER